MLQSRKETGCFRWLYNMDIKKPDKDFKTMIEDISARCDALY